MTDEHLSKLSTYYEYHDISSKYTLTFIDFVNCVLSGRWNEIINDIHGSIPYKGTHFKPLDSTIQLVVGESGYEVHEQLDGKTTITSFGAEEAARAKAMNYFEGQRGIHRETLLSI